jgi:HAD superfamily hydrolase (TIGR01549 family)
MVYEKLGRLAAKALSQGKRIVIDGTNLDDKRYGLIGNVLTQIPVDRVAFIIIRPPEWIMRKRLEDKGKEAVKEWWTIYKHWRTYVKQGVAVFPTSKNMPRINQIAIRRYSLKTFDWVPDIKAIMWDVDGTLYDSKVFTDHWNKQHIRRYSKARNLSFKKAEKEFWDKYVQLGSRTKVLEAAGINAKKHMDTMAMETDYSKVLGSNRKLHHLFDSLKHVRHYIFSNASRKATLKKLSGMKLDKGIFEDIFTTYEINQLTKDANSYDQVVKKTKLKPENILMVGDREEHDILPAKRVGMRTCYVWGVSKEADVSLPNVYEVAELFGVEV